jgi:hypothetical protein
MLKQSRPSHSPSHVKWRGAGYWQGLNQHLCSAALQPNQIHSIPNVRVKPPGSVLGDRPIEHNVKARLPMSRP